jgi:hypothetical protein
MSPCCHFVHVTQLFLGQLAGQDIEGAIALPLGSPLQSPCIGPVLSQSRAGSDSSQSES